MPRRSRTTLGSLLLLLLLPASSYAQRLPLTSYTVADGLPNIERQTGERGSEYERQSADQALTSAYVCANFATRASTGRDERFGLARPSE